MLLRNRSSATARIRRGPGADPQAGRMAARLLLSHGRASGRAAIRRERDGGPPASGLALRNRPELRCPPRRPRLARAANGWCSPGFEKPLPTSAAPTRSARARRPRGRASPPRGPACASARRHAEGERPVRRRNARGERRGTPESRGQADLQGRSVDCHKGVPPRTQPAGPRGRASASVHQPRGSDGRVRRRAGRQHARQARQGERLMPSRSRMASSVRSAKRRLASAGPPGSSAGSACTRGNPLGSRHREWESTRPARAAAGGTDRRAGRTHGSSSPRQRSGRRTGHRDPRRRPTSPHAPRHPISIISATRLQRRGARCRVRFPAQVIPSGHSG